MSTGKALWWSVWAVMAAVMSVAPSLHAAAQVDPATGVEGPAASPQASQEDELPSAAATGVGESSQVVEASEQSETDQAIVDRSGMLVGQTAAEDGPAEPTSAATGVHQ